MAEHLVAPPLPGYTDYTFYTNKLYTKAISANARVMNINRHVNPI